ncbi:hypothetical protein BN946_scf184354.g7 [Trametes cinnabarina]|uniref:F-box domain-containing protein n=1 Tax=Pycnoporus cinnabarinus TaxID=5643 RepID=A0A060S6L2_PYCCI|nr:hypothetical protein BN946_scf184354.g7 [Trametes cinnabarina]
MMSIFPRRASLPPELCDYTIDYLWDDIESLRACSLACRAWLPSSRFHLFRNVRLRHADDVERFRALLSSAPGIVHCVRKLSFSADYNGATPEGSPREDDAWVNGVAELLPMLSHVTALGIARVRWHALSDETRAAFAGLFKGVRQLFLFEVSFDASRDVIAFLSGFPALEELYFQAVSWKHDSPSPFEDPNTLHEYADAGSMHLSYLFLDPKSSPTLVTEWILKHPESQQLRSIQLCWRELQNTQAVGDLLQASGASLESLHVEFPAGISEDAVLQNHLSLAHNTGLRSLHFGGLDVRASRAFVSTRLFPWVTVMLTQVRSRYLQEVSFSLEITSVQDLLALDWARIDRDLSRTEFHGMTVMFYVSCERDGLGKDIRKEIATRLSGFQQRGTLSVSCI